MLIGQSLELLRNMGVRSNYFSMHTIQHPLLCDDCPIRYNERKDVKDFDRINEKMDSGAA